MINGRGDLREMVATVSATVLPVASRYGVVSLLGLQIPEILGLDIL